MVTTQNYPVQVHESGFVASVKVLQISEGSSRIEVLNYRTGRPFFSQKD